MPWHVARSSSCPASKPWAVIKDADGTVEGCHASQEAAQRQVAALYASEEKAGLIHHKSFDIDVKSADPESGQFEATVAVFGNVDSMGDRIKPGAFTKTLERWRAAGDPLPVILSHKHDDPMAHIGIADPNDVIESDAGLFVKGQLDVAENEVAAQVHRLMKRRSLKEFSFGYRIPKGGEKRGRDGINELVEIDLIEVGPTLKGANPSTELHAVKSALEKAVWTAAYINSLPDSAFLYVESGGTKDDEGKTTPRSLRHFPYKDASGKVDLAHLRNAASRIPQSNLPGDVKERLSKRVERLLAEQKDEAPDEKSLRRASEESQLRDLVEGLPSPEALERESVEQLTTRVEQLSGELEDVRAGVKSPERESALRRRIQEDRLRELDVPEVELDGEDRLKAVEEELALVKAALERKEPEPRPEPLSADELRRRHGMERLKDAQVPVGNGSPPAFESEAVNELKDAVELLVKDVGTIKAELEKPPPEPEPTEEELRRKDARERLEGTPPPVVEEKPDPIAELQARVDALVEAVGKHVELTEKRLTRIEGLASEEPEGAKEAGQDSLRRRSEEVVLEVSSRGLSRVKPPAPRESQAVDDGEDEKSLRKRSRDVMLEILNG